MTISMSTDVAAGKKTTENKKQAGELEKMVSENWGKM